MSEKLELFIALAALLLVFIITRRYHAWRIRRSYRWVVDDLKAAAAHSPDSAVDLPYARKNLLRIGLRDHRKMALNHLAMEQIVGITDDGRYYLLNREV